jgi:hypothetical protein
MVSDPDMNDESISVMVILYFLESVDSNDWSNQVIRPTSTINSDLSLGELVGLVLRREISG